MDSQNKQPATSPYIPPGWDSGDLKAASIEWNQFVSNSRAFQWLGHYLGEKERIYHAFMSAGKPSEMSHAEFVELGSRVNEIRLIWQAFEILTAYENTMERSPQRGQEITSG